MAPLEHPGSLFALQKGALGTPRLGHTRKTKPLDSKMVRSRHRGSVVRSKAEPLDSKMARLAHPSSFMRIKAGPLDSKMACLGTPARS